MSVRVVPGPPPAGDFDAVRICAPETEQGAQKVVLLFIFSK